MTRSTTTASNSTRSTAPTKATTGSPLAWRRSPSRGSWGNCAQRGVWWALGALRAPAASLTLAMACVPPYFSREVVAALFIIAIHVVAGAARGQHDGIARPGYVRRTRHRSGHRRLVDDHL